MSAEINVPCSSTHGCCQMFVTLALQLEGALASWHLSIPGNDPGLVQMCAGRGSPVCGHICLMDVLALLSLFSWAEECPLLFQCSTLCLESLVYTSVAI